MSVVVFAVVVEELDALDVLDVLEELDDSLLDKGFEILNFLYFKKSNTPKMRIIKQMK